jgi:hypothetical protein
MAWMCSSLHLQATARSLSLPTSTLGGALSLPVDRSLATATSSSCATARLRGRDGRITVDLPACAFLRRLDRLTHAWTTGSATAAYDETYTYSTIGNLTNKDGVAYVYPASGATSVRPHTPSSVGGAGYVYDANGNLLSGAGRSYTWSVNNLLVGESQTSGSESYSYDGDGERVKVVRGSTTTVYLEGLWEEVAGGAAKSYYTVNGQTVAVRDRSSNAVTYLHGDHLGSVSVATNASGALASQQEYTPFGSHRGTGWP